MNTFVLHFGPDGAEDGRFYRTVSGECIADGGAWQVQGYDENVVSISERKTHWCTQSVGAVLEKSRAKDDKLSIWDPTVFS